MTKAEKLMKEASLHITLHSEKSDSHANQEDDYIAEFKPAAPNPLHITDVDYDPDERPGNAICLSYESAVELAKFLKDLFLDESSEN
jgi:hypothetical protein